MVRGGGWGAECKDSCIWRGQGAGLSHGRIDGLGRRPGELYVGIPAFGGARGLAGRTVGLMVWVRDKQLVVPEQEQGRSRAAQQQQQATKKVFMKQGNKEERKQGSKEARQQGSQEARKQGSKQASKQASRRQKRGQRRRQTTTSSILLKRECSREGKREGQRQMQETGLQAIRSPEGKGEGSMKTAPADV